MKVTIWKKNYGNSWRPFDYRSAEEAVADLVVGGFREEIRITRPLELQIVEAVEKEPPEISTPEPERTFPAQSPQPVVDLIDQAPGLEPLPLVAAPVESSEDPF